MKMGEVNGYVYEENWKIVSNAEWVFAKKNGESYFLKKFQSPKYPSSEQSERGQEKQKRECEDWLARRNQVIDALCEVSSGSGNIVTPLEIFRDGYTYYQVTRKVNTETVSMEELGRLSVQERLLMLITLFAALKKVHSVEIVHGDLKPDNIIIQKQKDQKTGEINYICKIIDFDDSYLSGNPPQPVETVGTEPYWSPELGYYKLTLDIDRKRQITCKSDVFALGLIIHQYCTGGRFPKLDGIHYPYQIVSTKQILTADTSIQPLELQDMINRMLLLSPAKRPTMNELFQELQELRKNVESKKLNAQEMAEETQDGTETCQVTIKTNLPEAGTALVNGRTSVTVKREEHVRLEAAEKEGYEFVEWRIGKKGCKEKKCYATIYRDTFIDAVFEKLGSEWIKGKGKGISYRSLQHGKVEVRYLNREGNVKKQILDKWLAEDMGWI